LPYIISPPERKRPVTSSELQKLYRIQELDLTLLQLKREAQLIPERREKAEARLRAAQCELDAATEAVRGREKEIRNAEGDVEAVHSKVRRYRMQQMDVKSNEAFRALEHEISGCDAEIEAAENKVLEWMESLETLQEIRKVQEAGRAAVAGVVAGELQGMDERMQTIREQFEELKSTREAVAAEVDAEILKRYLNHLSSKQDAYLVPAKQLTCGGCHMKLSPQTLHDLHAAVKWTHCTFCGRLLYDPALLQG